MDDFRSITTKLKVSATEVALRRKMVRRADANNRLEGICRDPASDAIFEALVRGDIEATDIVPRLKAQIDRCRKSRRVGTIFFPPW